MTTPQVPLAALIGTNARRIRMQAGATLDDVAQWARVGGARWPSSTIVAIEQGRRAATLETMLVLSDALSRASDTEVRLADLLACDSPVRVEIAKDGTHVSAESITSSLSGAPVDLDAQGGDIGRQWEAVALEFTGLAQEVRRVNPDLKLGTLIKHEQRGPTLAESRAADALKVALPVVYAAALYLWGRPLDVERDERAGPSASPQKRGRVTRELLSELRAHIAAGSDDGGDS